MTVRLVTVTVDIRYDALGLVIDIPCMCVEQVYPLLTAASGCDI